MDRAERMAESASSSFVSAVVAGFVGSFAWLVRRVLTNQRQIELLQAEINHRDKQRTEDREAMQDLRSDVKEIRKVVMGGAKG